MWYQMYESGKGGQRDPHPGESFNVLANGSRREAQSKEADQTTKD